MDYKTAVRTMRKYFADNYSDTPIVLGSDDVANNVNTPWVRFNVIHGDGFQASMGSPSANRFERNGIITVQIFTPQGDNGVSAINLADKILKIYEGVENNGILYYDATVKEVGNDGRGWYQVNVLTSFRYETIT